MKQVAADTEPYARAKALLAKKDFDGALEALDGILEKNEEDAAALALAGDVYAATGDIAQAMGHYGLAVQTAPNDINYKRQFINIAGSTVLTQYNPAIENILSLCLETPEIDCDHAQALWHSLMRTHPQFQPLMKNLFEKPADLGFLFQPIFLTGIKRLVVCDAGFETFMTALRRFLLEKKEALPSEKYHALIEAVAQYCFNTDYIFDRTEAEEKVINHLRRELEDSAAARQDIVKTGLYACYEPFYKLAAAKDMALLPALKAQLEDYLDLRDRATKIPSLTEVTDGVSLKVRGQYEEFPYPRWRELPPPSQIKIANSPAEEKAALQTLFAGCGTGRESLPYAHAYPKTSILAIDLSRTSLAYAARKAEEFGIKNMEFRHADILRLGSLDRTFDRIYSMGVLHHMQDPLAGWKILTNLLKPRGLMRIGLYSAAARRSVVTAKEIIRQKNYPDTAAGMRRFRKDSPKLLGKALNDRIFGTMDYYYLNMYRDLLFHVQEHRFTLPQIKDILAELKLEFLEISVTPATQQLYSQRFPADPQRRSLDNWHKMEEADPDLFCAMYNLWLAKPKPKG